MAKRHCANHKRYVHNCPGCQSEALKETVGFPKTEGEEKPPEQEGPYPEGAPGPDAKPEEETTSGVVGGGGISEAAPEDEEGGDIAEWEPEVEETTPDPLPEGFWQTDKVKEAVEAESAPAPLPSYVPAGEQGDEPDLPEVRDIDETEEAMAAEGEFDPASHPVTPGEGEPEQAPADATLTQEEIAEGSSMSPIDVAMMLFPRRLIPEGATEVCDEERPDEPYMASYEELIRRAVIGYINVGLEPEDAAIVVASEVIQAEKMAPDFGGVEEETEDAFEAGLEAAPELTGCIEDHNAGFNAGMAALRNVLRNYYAGDEDAPAYSLGLWLDKQMAGMKK